MSLKPMTGLEIFKLLPKTNCKKCGMPTCLAFAMQLAQKRAKLDDCPDVSDEAKKLLAAAAAPPMKLVRVGPEGYEEALGRPHAKVFDLTGKPMKGWITVAPGGHETDEALADWVQQGVDFALSLPASRTSRS